MKRLSMTILLLVLLASGSAAQGLYSLKYLDSNLNPYEALFSWYGPAQLSVMRIRYTEPTTRQSILVEQSITVVPAPDGFILQGSQPHFISAPVGQKYNSDSFIFGRCPNWTFPCIWVVDEVTRKVGVMGEFRPLSPFEIATVLQRFGYPAQTPAVAPPQKITLHLVVVADTDALDIGRGDEVDANAIQREFGIAAKEVGIVVRTTIISGKQFGKDAVLSTLNGLNPGTNDVVVFAYSGHGFRLKEDSDIYPRLDLSRDRRDPRAYSISASEVYQILKKKRARLNITLVDTCNDVLPEEDLGSAALYSLKLSASAISSRAIATLFLNTRGNIIVAAAGVGQNAETLANKGGRFISAFLDAFRSETSVMNHSGTSWQTIISRAKEGASRNTRGKQTAISYIE